MADGLLDAADTLLAQGRRSSAFRRRAVSTAYYAIFHALAKTCADYLTRSANRTSGEYQRVYRSLDHAVLKNAFGREPLSGNTRLGGIGATAVRLQTERHRADYLPPVPGTFSAAETQELIDLARVAVSEIQRIKPQHKDCRMLATGLLFRDRKQ